MIFKHPFFNKHLFDILLFSLSLSCYHIISSINLSLLSFYLLLSPSIEGHLGVHQTLFIINYIFSTRSGFYIQEYPCVWVLLPSQLLTFVIIIYESEIIDYASHAFGRQTLTIQAPRLVSWKHPPIHNIALNVDGSVHGDPHGASFRCLCPDWQGNICCLVIKSK